MKEIQFHLEGRRECVKTPRLKLPANGRWNEGWNITGDIDTVLVFLIVITNERPDLVNWNEKDKKAMLLDLIVLWKENFEQAEERKEKRYEDFKNMNGKLNSTMKLLLGKRFGCNKKEIKEIAAELQGRVLLFI